MLAAFVVLGLAFGGGQLVSESETIFEKGRPEAVGTLNSRTEYWSAAAVRIRERPVIGYGLNVESRRILTEDLGLPETSTLHSTWVEATVGTGLVGVAFLAASLFGSTLRAFRLVAVKRAAAIPLAIYLVIIVRSFTGTTIELFAPMVLVFLSATLVLHRLRVAERAITRVHGFGSNRPPSRRGTRSASRI
jgi:O-antigen ligase